jgi:hypothetical protein
MMSIEQLVSASDAPNPMVFCGEELNYGENVWKMYGFLRQFIKPMWPVSDEMETSHVAFIVDDMIGNLNVMLEDYGLMMDYSGGNLYLVESLMD